MGEACLGSHLRLYLGLGPRPSACKQHPDVPAPLPNPSRSLFSSGSLGLSLLETCVPFPSQQFLAFSNLGYSPRRKLQKSETPLFGTCWWLSPA